VTRPVLLDTHVLLWMASEPDRLSAAASDAIATASAAWASHASLWELAIKAGLGKIALAPDAGAWFAAQTALARLAELTISGAHLAAVEHLPPHHRDPFDRLLVAQAQIEGLALVTADARLLAYGVPIVW
jgi:PIN domain nuclease of toxin-antitoxin system